MTALLYTLGVLLFAVAVLASIALHEVGHLIPAKLFNVKVTQYFVGFGRTLWSQAGRRDRVRRQGDPARWLLQDRRDAAARPRTATSRAAQHRHVHPAGRRRPRRRVTSTSSRGRRGPAVLQDALVAEGHHHGLRPVGEPRDRVRPLRGLFTAYGNIGDPVTEPTVAEVRDARCRTPTSDRAVHGRRPRRPGERRRAPAGRPDRLLQRHRDRRLGQVQQRDPRQRRRQGVRRRRARRRRADARPPDTIVSARPSATDAEDETLHQGRLPRRAADAVEPSDRRPRSSPSTRWARDRRDRADARRAAGEGLRRRQASSALEERDPNGPMSVVGAGRVAGETGLRERPGHGDRPSSR